jgi:hypothetical protein
VFVKQHSGWTYADYDAAAASDLLLDAEFAKVETALAQAAKEKLTSG